MSDPSPTLNAAVLEAVLDVDLRTARPLHDVWIQLVSRLRDQEAKLIPLAFDRTLPLLVADNDRLLVATSLINSFDLFEALPSLLTLSRRYKSPDLALAAAAFAQHPGISDPTARIVAEDIPSQVPMSANQREAFAIRLRPGEEALTPRSAELRRAMWPGIDGGDGLPIVYIVEKDAPPRLEMLSMGWLRAAGIRVRRIPETPAKTPLPAWFGRQSLIVTWTENTVSQLRNIGVSATPGQIVLGPRSDAEQVSFIRRVTSHLGRPSTAPSQPQPLLEERILTPELLELGSFDIKDMAYLGGGRLSTLYRLSSGGRLRPRYISGGHRTGMWSFAQLIAYRTWRYFSLRSGRRQFPAGLVPELESLARSVDVAHVAVAADGRLLERDQSERELNVQSPWHDRETGQEIFEEVLTIDQVFEPFSLGGGRVPHLVHPSRYTHVDPSILGGTPTVRTARIAARAIAEIERKQGRDAVREAYPELSLEELSDALRVGLELVGKS